MMPLTFFLVFILVFAVAILLVSTVWQSLAPRTPHDLSDETIRQLVQDGKRIQAISGYRRLHGVGLKAAKAAVDEMISKL
ncbi:MAG: hypothetical protein WBA57_14730 [Elainellaceae cyanobacterium]